MCLVSITVSSLNNETSYLADRGHVQDLATPGIVRKDGDEGHRAWMELKMSL